MIITVRAADDEGEGGQNATEFRGASGGEE